MLPAPDYALFLRRHIEEQILLSDEEFAQVIACFEPLALARHGHLITVGQRVPSEFLVVQGCLKTSAYDAAGKEYIVQFALENWWVSDFEAYTRQTPAELTVEALEPSFVLGITWARRAEMCEHVPKMYIFFGSKALRGYVAAHNRVLSLLRHSAREKYELLLRLYPELFQRLPKKTIAHYLGVSRETLSRLEKKDPAAAPYQVAGRPA